MCSLLKNKNADTKVDIYCMVSPRMQWRARRTIRNLVSKYAGCRLIWRVVRAGENPFVGQNYSRWSPVIFYRLFAHRLFGDVGRMLYLDSDTLIFGDLVEMYNTELDNNIIGAVVDCALVDDYNNYMGQYVREFQEKHNPDGHYVNSGVLLIDTTRRAELDALAGYTNIDGFSCPDQDLINMAFAGKIKYLSMRYNFSYASAVSQRYDQADFLDAHNNYVIYHFYTRKPHMLAPAQRALEQEYKKMCADMGWTMDDMLRHESKFTSTKTHIPGLSMSSSGIRFFGILFK